MSNNDAAAGWGFPVRPGAGIDARMGARAAADITGGGDETLTGTEHGVVTLVRCRTSFEAEAIAAALRERGVEAFAADVRAGALIPNEVTPPRVVVLAEVADEARATLEEIQQEASKIDWETIDMVEDEAEPVTPPGRFAWTISLLLVPIGLVTLAFGSQRNDHTLQTIGGAVLAAAAAIAIGMAMAKRNGDE